MSDTHYVKAVDVEEWAALCGKFKQERDEARRELFKANEYNDELYRKIKELENKI